MLSQKAFSVQGSENLVWLFCLKKQILYKHFHFHYNVRYTKDFQQLFCVYFDFTTLKYLSFAFAHFIFILFHSNKYVLFER